MTSRRVDLVRTVSKRLLVAMLVLLVVFIVALIVTISTIKTPTAILIVFLAGQIGGYVGVQCRVKALPLEDLELLATSWICTVLSPLVGGVLAVALYFIFVSELITGHMFPVFVPDSEIPDTESIRMLFAQHGQNYTDYAKLMVWSFIAGYSERFVINVISSFTKDDGDV